MMEEVPFTVLTWIMLVVNFVLILFRLHMLEKNVKALQDALKRKEHDESRWLLDD